MAKNQEFTLEVVVCLLSLVAWCVNADFAPRSVDTCTTILEVSYYFGSSTASHKMKVVLAASTTSTNSLSNLHWSLR